MTAASSSPREANIVESTQRSRIGLRSVRRLLGYLAALLIIPVIVIFIQGVRGRLQPVVRGGTSDTGSTPSG